MSAEKDNIDADAEEEAAVEVVMGEEEEDDNDEEEEDESPASMSKEVIMVVVAGDDADANVVGIVARPWIRAGEPNAGVLRREWFGDPLRLWRGEGCLERAFLGIATRLPKMEARVGERCRDGANTAVVDRALGEGEDGTASGNVEGEADDDDDDDSEDSAEADWMAL